MENVWKKAGTLLGNLFTGKPDISEEEKTALKSALDEDVAAALATANARVSELEGQVTAATTAKETAEGRVGELEAEVSALQQSQSEKEGKIAGLEAQVNEFSALKTQMDNYKAQVGGAKPTESKTGDKTADQEAAEKYVEEQERLKAQYPYSMGAA